MTKTTDPQSLKRFAHSLDPLFSTGKPDLVFLKSSTDVGVERNGGRNGARLGPRSFLSLFKKLNQNESWSKKILTEVEVSDEKRERADFHAAQESEAQNILYQLEANPEAAFCHLGGGHDHALPLLLALDKKFKKIIVINIDAHADTRTDDDGHSGTPFRHFDLKGKAEYHLFQFGLHEYANSQATLSPLKKGKMEIVWKHEGSVVVETFNMISSLIDANTAVVFSLDADALNGAQMPGVSAVNGNGFQINELNELWAQYRCLNLSHAPLIGIYELNPVYDSISSLSVRTLAGFVFEAFR